VSTSKPILILGAGSWGTALAITLARNKQSILLWDIDAPHIQRMQASRRNEKFLPDVELPDNVHIIPAIEDYIPQVDHILVVVPSHGFYDIMLKMASYVTENTHICWATKGLEEKRGLLLHQVAQQILGKQQPLSVLSGPSFAGEVALKMPTAVTIASKNINHAREWVNLFHHDYFRAYTSTDIVGVQLGGAVKNIIAIAAGIADGLGFGANTQAALITRGLTEIMRLGDVLGGKRETFMGLAGLGDLILTCTDNQSRNRRFGYAIAQGTDFAQAQATIGQVVEGVRVARIVKNLAEKHQIDMPIVIEVNKVLQGLISPKEAVESLLSREPRHETE